MSLALAHRRLVRLSQNRLAFQKRWSNTQHRVFLLPEVPEDSDATNPILKKPHAGSFLEHAEITSRDAYFGLGKALLLMESAANDFDVKCEEASGGDGHQLQLEELLQPLEEAKCHLETVWSTVILLSIVSDRLDMDRFALLYKRAEEALMSRYRSKTTYAVLKDIKAKCAEGQLGGQEARLLDRMLLEFHKQGFDLDRKNFDLFTGFWSKSLVESCYHYDFKLKTCTNRYHHLITNPVVVQDFPPDVLRAMSSDSSQPNKGPWTLTFHPYIYRQFMAYCPDRKLRWSAHSAYVSRGSQAEYSRVLSEVREIRKHRQNQAVTLGYPSYADMSLSTKMAATVDNVQTMIDRMKGKAKKSQEEELENLQSYAESRGFDETIEVYDVDFFKRRQRQSMLGLSDEELRQYFPFPTVLAGIFQLCSKLFNVQIEEVAPSEAKPWVWHRDVRLFRVIDNGASGQVLGHFFLDPYIRDDKGFDGGDKGWFVPIKPRSQVAKSMPYGALIMSLPPPSVLGGPSLLSFFEVEELLRNFGNAFMHLLCDVNWSDFCGKYGLEWDALDIAGSFMTHWLYHPDVIHLLSGHWSTKAAIPRRVVDQLCGPATRHHLAGYELCRKLFYACYDQMFYSIDCEQESYQDLQSRLHSEFLLLPATEDDAFPLYFQQIMTGDWPAAVYSSIWSKMIAADIFSAVQEAVSEAGTNSKKAIYDMDEVRKVTYRFRKSFLAVGSSVSTSATFRQFRGRDPSHEALMISLGLKSAQQPKKKGTQISAPFSSQ